MCIPHFPLRKLQFCNIKTPQYVLNWSIEKDVCNSLFTLFKKTNEKLSHERTEWQLTNFCVGTLSIYTHTPLQNTGMYVYTLAAALYFAPPCWFQKQNKILFDYLKRMGTFSLIKTEV